MSNPQRGCGTKKAGGSYLECDMSEFGSLQPVTYVLGSHHASGDWGDVMRSNIFTHAPQRAMTEIDPAATLTLNRVVNNGDIVDWSKEDDFAFKRYLVLADKIGTYGLLDYVGSQYYSPNSFVRELLQYGPSRKVPQNFMLEMTRMFPIPVLFCHRDMVLFNCYADAEMYHVGIRDEDEPFLETPTWHDPEWGPTVHDGNYGQDHYMASLMEWIGNFEFSMHHPFISKTFLNNESLKQHGTFVETIFCLSWFTKGTYVLLDENDPGVEGVDNILLTEQEVV